jgi:hypothetical protein
MWMIEEAQVAMLPFLVVISLPGVQENKLRSPNRVQKPNIRPLLMLLPRLFGFKSCFVNLGFLCPGLQVFGATYLTANPIFHRRMKHVEVDYHFVRGHVAMKQLDVHTISSKDQLSDIMTKVLPAPAFTYLRHNLNLLDRCLD